MLLVIGIGWWWSEQTRRSAPRRNPSPARIEAAAASVDQKSIAVLPFENLSHDPENAYFAEGVSDSVAKLLANDWIHFDRLLFFTKKDKKLL